MQILECNFFWIIFFGDALYGSVQAFFQRTILIYYKDQKFIFKC